MSNRLAAAYADAWFAADFASSKRALKDDIFAYREEYSAAANKVSDLQTQEMESKSLWEVLGGVVGAAVGFFSGGGPGGAILGWELGTEGAEIAFDTGYLRTGDDELDAMVAELEAMEFELSDKAGKYGVLEGRETRQDFETEKDQDILAYESWSDKFYQDAFGHLTDLASIYATNELFQILSTDFLSSGVSPDIDPYDIVHVDPNV